jgi:hypothetical protein
LRAIDAQACLLTLLLDLIRKCMQLRCATNPEAIAKSLRARCPRRRLLLKLACRHRAPTW